MCYMATGHVVTIILIDANVRISYSVIPSFLVSVFFIDPYLILIFNMWPSEPFCKNLMYCVKYTSLIKIYAHFNHFA